MIMLQRRVGGGCSWEGRESKKESWAAGRGKVDVGISSAEDMRSQCHRIQEKLRQTREWPTSATLKRSKRPSSPFRKPAERYSLCHANSKRHHHHDSPRVCTRSNRQNEHIYMRDNVLLHRFIEKCNQSHYQLCATLPVDTLVIPASTVLTLPHLPSKVV
jgi:hypothetical protein